MATGNHSSLPAIVQSGDYSDFTLTCEAQSFKLHRVIVCPKSPVITRALEGNFEVGSLSTLSRTTVSSSEGQEATSKVIRVEQFDLATVTRMIIFLYTGDYEFEPPCKDSKTSPDQSKDSSPTASKTEDDTGIELLGHLRMNSIADYYDIESLVKCANSKILPLLDTSQTALLPQLLQEVSTSTSDKAVQSMIASSVASRIEDIVELPGLSMTNSSSSILIEILMICGRRVRDLEARLQDTESLLETKRIERYRLARSLRGCLSVVNNTSGCGRCGTKFKCHLEWFTREDDELFVVWCNRCRKMEHIVDYRPGNLERDP
ncbi:hypothetical protein NW762_013881 [Fusarium torreyae]|uniref:BTB domain-containing protein n=1 Tax=Fusarium torreyae TaxID=1237075 RepID=A0A9W8RL27_9HYPO|nr:hypothetical protein NW762_013881 [Fusarium torreyae]